MEKTQIKNEIKFIVGSISCISIELHDLQKQLKVTSEKLNDLYNLLNEEVLAEEKSCDNCGHFHFDHSDKPCLVCRNFNQWKSKD